VIAYNEAVQASVAERFFTAVAKNAHQAQQVTANILAERTRVYRWVRGTLNAPVANPSKSRLSEGGTPWSNTSGALNAEAWSVDARRWLRRRKPR
jgi:hypothetical protein